MGTTYGGNDKGPSVSVDKLPLKADQSTAGPFPTKGMGVSLAPGLKSKSDANVSSDAGMTGNKGY